MGKRKIPIHCSFDKMVPLERLVPNWCEAPTRVKQVKDRPLVGHMSVFNARCEKERADTVNGRPFK